MRQVEPSSLASKRVAMVGVSHKAASVEVRERLRERVLVESLTAQIMNKFLHEPTIRMKRAATGPAGLAYAGAVQHLFGDGEEPR
jgi:glutamyl-tRNA reductase